MTNNQYSATIAALNQVMDKAAEATRQAGVSAIAGAQALHKFHETMFAPLNTEIAEENINFKTISEENYKTLSSDYTTIEDPLTCSWDTVEESIDNIDTITEVAAYVDSATSIGAYKPPTRISTKICLRCDSEDNWRRNNPQLLRGEVAIVFGYYQTRLKVGDGEHNFNDLPYVT